MMSKGFAGGVITGAVLGAALGMFVDPMSDRQHRKIKKQTNNMFKTLGSVVDSIMDNW